jgi:hypothetical protein
MGPQTFYVEHDDGFFVSLDCAFDARGGDYTPAYTVSLVPSPSPRVVTLDESELRALFSAPSQHLH